MCIVEFLWCILADILPSRVCQWCEATHAGNAHFPSPLSTVHTKSKMFRGCKKRKKNTKHYYYHHYHFFSVFGLSWRHCCHAGTQNLHTEQRNVIIIKRTPDDCTLFFSEWNRTAPVIFYIWEGCTTKISAQLTPTIYLDLPVAARIILLAPLMHSHFHKHFTARSHDANTSRLQLLVATFPSAFICQRGCARREEQTFINDDNHHCHDHQKLEAWLIVSFDIMWNDNPQQNHVTTEKHFLINMSLIWNTDIKTKLWKSPSRERKQHFVGGFGRLNQKKEKCI